MAVESFNLESVQNKPMAICRTLEGDPVSYCTCSHLCIYIDCILGMITNIINGKQTYGSTWMV